MGLWTLCSSANSSPVGLFPRALQPLVPLLDRPNPLLVLPDLPPKHRGLRFPLVVVEIFLPAPVLQGAPNRFNPVKMNCLGCTVLFFNYVLYRPE